MAYEAVLYEKKGRIAYITLNRPASANALNSQMHRELVEIWDDFKKDPEVWIGIITGAGERHFCTGADMKEAAASYGQGQEVARWRIETPRSEALGYPGEHEVWKPLILAINGICCGGGLHFINDTDIAICSENAAFFDTHVSVGQVVAPEMIGLSRRIPLGLVLRMAMMGLHERIDAQRAYAIGLVSQVVPLPELLPTATNIAETILRNSPLAVRESKKAIRQGLDMGYTQARELGHYVVRALRGTEDQREGPRAYAEKRRPNWKAR